MSVRLLICRCEASRELELIVKNNDESLCQIEVDPGSRDDDCLSLKLTFSGADLGRAKGDLKAATDDRHVENLVRDNGPYRDGLEYEGQNPVGLLNHLISPAPTTGLASLDHAAPIAKPQSQGAAA